MFAFRSVKQTIGEINTIKQDVYPDRGVSHELCKLVIEGLKSELNLSIILGEWVR
ncbi:hypothetical protein [Proteiniphilum acetatigenes]|uniref:hypothetical protein n=1 Tax=Proteiniphilum acetatigenes TaxID=294710 RepID=UPI000361B053|nr:hypothetical protein [Proteiniphilum acetatigenes]